MEKKLILLTYTPRELDEEEYANFMREDDYPVFRQNPHIVSYTGWRTVENVQGKEEFTHFDLFEVRDFADLPEIIGDPIVAEHIERWTRDWSKHGPDPADPADNFKITFCEQY